MECCYTPTASKAAMSADSITPAPLSTLRDPQLNLPFRMDLSVRARYYACLMNVVSPASRVTNAMPAHIANQERMLGVLAYSGEGGQ